MGKSYVSVAYTVCPICHKEKDDSLLLDKRLRDSMDVKTFTGFKLCDTCKKEGHVVLVVIDIAKSELDENGTITPNGAYKTGDLIYIKEEAFIKSFNIKGKKGATPEIVYIDEQVAAQIKEGAKNSNSRAISNQINNLKSEIFDGK